MAPDDIGPDFFRPKRSWPVLPVLAAATIAVSVYGTSTFDSGCSGLSCLGGLFFYMADGAAVIAGILAMVNRQDSVLRPRSNFRPVSLVLLILAWFLLSIGLSR
jgi:hypothetical protein